ncbi:hypothetical protein M0R45_031963 [Rubus argutus]|uniref:Transmembrane protein n=1 Tax=Rubus argutus TaxID=59490 RepID=A0AAW1WFU8_RUBAR
MDHEECVDVGLKKSSAASWCCCRFGAVILGAAVAWLMRRQQQGRLLRGRFVDWACGFGIDGSRRGLFWFGFGIWLRPCGFGCCEVRRWCWFCARAVMVCDCGIGRGLPWWWIEALEEMVVDLAAVSSGLTVVSDGDGCHRLNGYGD